MRRVRPRGRPRDATSALRRVGLRAVQRRMAQAAAALVVLMVSAAAAAASAATAAVAPALSSSPAARPPPAPLPDVRSNKPIAEPQQEVQPSANSSLTGARPVASRNGPPLAAPRILPGSSLTGAPNPDFFEVFPGCRTHAYGIPGLPNFIVYCESNDTAGQRNVSYWHDIPLNLSTDPRDNSTTMWVTVEIPKGTNAKIETQTTLPHTPMAQSTITTPPADWTARTAQQLRYYRLGPSLVNYGGVPQTWEASDLADATTGQPSDNDPLDFIEISGVPLPVGAVVRVRLLGALSLVDTGETDWKLVVVNTKDPATASWRDIGDVPPATQQQLYEFFRTYKVTDGKQANKFFVVESNTTTTRPEDWQVAYVGRAAAAEVVASKNAEWKRLLGGGCTTPRCEPLLAAARAGGSAGAVGASTMPSGK